MNKCNDCHGTGKANEAELCESCAGTGYAFHIVIVEGDYEPEPPLENYTESNH